jgi:hypothetical protein
MTNARPAVTLVRLVWLVASIGMLGGCKKKVTQEQCDRLLDHFAELVVKEHAPDAGADRIQAERDKERREAAHADEFKNCTSEVQTTEFDCAMNAPTSDAVIKCLE